MDSTSVSLLERISEPNQEPAWKRFVDLYAPLIFHWSRRQGLSETDAADMVQEVMTLLIQKLPEFRLDPSRSFRAWLKTVTGHKAKDFQTRRSTRPEARELAESSVAVADDVDLFDRSEYTRFLAGRALAIMRSDFEEKTWRACWDHVVEDRPARDVASELGITVNAVYVAKSRVLRRLRSELDGLL